MIERDMELKAILDRLEVCRQKYNIRQITISIEGNGHGHAHGWDGREQIYVGGNYAPYRAGGEEG